MAYQTRGRDPLLDSKMAEAIEKRGKELIGIGLVIVALAAAAMIASYNPNDPSWLSATDAPVQNWMGGIGAAIAAPLFMIIGWGSWGIAAALLAWGLRFALHFGADRAIGRLIFAPIWLALLSVYASTLVPGETWTHSFGLGGLFGDTVLGSLLGLLPVGASFGLKVLSLVLGAAMIAFGAFILGFTRPELRYIGRFLLIGTIIAYATVMKVLGKTATGAMTAAQTMQERNRARREQRAIARAEAAEWTALQDAQSLEVLPRAPAAYAHHDEPPLTAEPAEKTGLRALMPNLIRRAEPMPEQELVETAPQFSHGEPPAPSDDRIKAKIADVIKSRVRHGPTIQSAVAAPLTKGRGHGPVPLVLDTTPAHLRAEPPLTVGGIPSLPPEPQLTAAYAPEPQGFEASEANIFDDYADEAVIDEAFASEEVPAAPRAFSIPTAEPKKVVQHAVKKPVQTSTRAKAEAQPTFKFEDKRPVYELPPLSLLADPVKIERFHLSDEALEANARMLESVLDDYGVKGEIVSVRPGPVVTMYELEPAPGLKASRVIGLADDIARSMAALSARVSTVPGRSVIGIELPNDNREMVGFREILSGREYGDGNHKLPLALGKDIGGDPIVANLAKMPHLLIAGTTGSGKSVAINTMILSLLYKLTPEECRMIMIDPKMLELSVYDGIPHLLSPVVTDPKKAVVALKWTVGEMEERYRKMSKMGVRNIDGYNSRVADALAKGEMFSRTVQTGFDDDTGEPVFETEEMQPEKMPYIVVIVDEMADLMMVAGKEIEACIQRLAQMARASGIHIIMATQRPSVDVITGTIKANFPTRISFQVTSKIDSRTILGEMGAEQLLGMGDMLYMAGGAKITRCHGPFVSDEEVEEIVNHLKAFGPPEYVSGVVQGPPDDNASDIDAVLGLGGNTDGEDALYDTAVAIVIKDRKCSTSYIQRKLSIGYNKAAKLVEQMEDEGIISGANHVGKREILVPEQH